MARVNVPIDETSNDAISAKAAKLLGQERTEPQQLKAKMNVSKATLIKLGTGVLILGLVIFFVTLINDRNALKQQVSQLSEQPSTGQSNELANLQAELEKSLLLPTNETPELATVSEVDKLQGQAFFKEAQNGDQVLVYKKAGKAVLYRPSTKKIIQYLSINTSTTPDSTNAQP